jgi:hypothetical protein
MTIKQDLNGVREEAMQIPGDVKNFPDQGTSKLLSVREGTKERP